MSTAEALPTCRRKALFAAGIGLVQLVLAALAHVARLPISDTNLGLLTGLAVGLLFAALLLWFSPDTSDTVPRQLMSRYRREFMPAMAVYVVVVIFWKPLLGLVQAPWLRLLVALLPALLVLWIMRAFVRFVRDSDELQRRIELESGAIAGLLVSAAYMAAGFIQTAGLIDVPAKVAMLWVFPSLCLTYGSIKLVIARRYL